MGKSNEDEVTVPEEWVPIQWERLTKKGRPVRVRIVLRRDVSARPWLVSTDGGSIRLYSKTFEEAVRLANQVSLMHGGWGKECSSA